MRFTRIAAITLAAVVSIAAGKPNPAGPRANWNASVAVGEGGSHVLGNPDAKVKLTEYISYTCPHCAHFHEESDAPLRLAYVQPGKLSVEVRHLIRDPVDLAAALATNCGDPKRFFLNHNAVLRSQDRWITIMGTASAAQKQRWSAGSLGSRMKAIASDFGFYRLMEQRGYRAAALDQCLSNEAMARKLTAQTQAAVNAGVNATPSFLLDGKLLPDTHDWSSLNRQIQSRL